MKLSPGDQIRAVSETVTLGPARSARMQVSADACNLAIAIAEVAVRTTAYLSLIQ